MEAFTTKLTYGLPQASIAIALLTVLVSAFYLFTKSRGLPPGPIGLPIVGFWPLLRKNDVHIHMLELKKKYGDVFSFSIAGNLMISLSSHKAMREAHIAKADCFERFTDAGLLTLTLGDGVGFINGEPWKALRKFFLQEFKERGIVAVKDSMSDTMYDSISEALADLQASKGQSLNVIPLLTKKANAIVKSTLFGGGGITEEEIQEINEMYMVIMNAMTPTNLLLMGPVARYILLPRTHDFSGCMKKHKTLEEFIYEIIKRNESTYNENHIRNIVDSYIKERNSRKSKGDPSHQYFNDKALIQSLMQFIGDGALVVASFVSFYIKHVVEHPEEQEKIYKELVEVVGPERQPTIEDRSKLTYTNAYILEATRTLELMHLFPSQQCIKETTVGGYRIPKGAITVMNIWAINQNAETYEKPENFNPYRFLPKEGEKRPELPAGFGIGRRACMGESYVMNQVFLFLTTFVKNFKLEAPVGENANSLELLMVGKYFICAHSRENS